MGSACKCCGEPTADAEEHHVDQQRGNNHPDNLSTRCRRCHHTREHDNRRAVDGRTSRQYGPPSPSGGPP